MADHRDHRASDAEGEGARSGDADPQAGERARSHTHGDTAQVGYQNTRMIEGVPNQRTDDLRVPARVRLVQLHQHTRVAVDDRHTGASRGINREQHRPTLSPASAGRGR